MHCKTLRTTFSYWNTVYYELVSSSVESQYVKVLHYILYSAVCYTATLYCACDFHSLFGLCSYRTVLFGSFSRAVARLKRLSAIPFLLIICLCDSHQVLPAIDLITLFTCEWHLFNLLSMNNLVLALGYKAILHYLRIERYLYIHNAFNLCNYNRSFAIIDSLFYFNDTTQSIEFRINCLVTKLLWTFTHNLL